MYTFCNNGGANAGQGLRTINRARGPVPQDYARSGAFEHWAGGVGRLALASPVLASLVSAAVLGIEAQLVHVEVDVSTGLPGFTMVGLPDASVRESRDRVRSAIRNSGLTFPPHRITVNLAPADQRKEGASFDLPIALGVLAASGAAPHRTIRDVIVVGELSLDGSIHPARGVLPVAIAARRQGVPKMMLPPANAAEAAVIEGLRVLPVRTLPQALHALSDPDLAARTCAPPVPAPQPPAPDLSDVRGQLLARRAVEIAAAGGHHLLLSGPPGSGKTMLARRIPGILPPLTFEESLETTSIHSVAGLLRPGSALLTGRPFRAPHHTISDIALVGGGVVPRPGEISLAHNGVLFLDEVPEFARGVLEVLRQPLEEGRVRIARASRAAEFPASFQLVAAMNPCPCGYLGDVVRTCRCTPCQIDRYRQRLSGPFLDRIDLTVDVPAIPMDTYCDLPPGEPSSAVAARVRAARDRQRRRSEHGFPRLNSQLEGDALRSAAAPTADAWRVLQRAAARFGWSARVFDRVLKVARTVGDLEGEDRVDAPHAAEALCFRGGH